MYGVVQRSEILLLLVDGVCNVTNFFDFDRNINNANERHMLFRFDNGLTHGLLMWLPVQHMYDLGPDMQQVQERTILTRRCLLRHLSGRIRGCRWWQFQFVLCSSGGANHRTIHTPVYQQCQFSNRVHVLLLRPELCLLQSQHRQHDRCLQCMWQVNLSARWLVRRYLPGTSRWCGYGSHASLLCLMVLLALRQTQQLIALKECHRETCVRAVRQLPAVSMMKE